MHSEGAHQALIIYSSREILIGGQRCFDYVRISQGSNSHVGLAAAARLSDLYIPGLYKPRVWSADYAG